MHDFIKQDIFFFIATVAVVLVAVFSSILLVYVIRIARNVSHITRTVRTETDIITAELGELRNNIRTEGVKLKHFSKFFTAFRGRKK